MDSKPLVFSKSFWAIAMMAITGVDWIELVTALEKLLSGTVPAEWQPVVHAAAVIIIALFGIFGVAKRKTTIKGIL